MDEGRTLIENRKIELEKKGIFDEHITPVDMSIVIPVDDHFHYIKKTFKEKAVVFRNELFAIKPYTWYQNHIVKHTKVYGRENIKGIKRAVVTCNHVTMFDCLVVFHGMRGHKVHAVAATFNNFKGTLGNFMRSSGMLPLGATTGAMKNFNRAVDYYLQHDKYVLIYPEQAMWEEYEKPRPYKRGAFYYAVKNNVPIIPTFITFTDLGKVDKNGNPRKKFHYHIMPAIYAPEGLQRKEKEEYLRNAAFEACKNKYEEFYGKKLTYTCDEGKE